jgi:hypothetical protein
MDTSQLVIAIHPPFARLVDWSVLARGRPCWHLLTSPASLAELVASGRSDALTEAAALDAFDHETLRQEVARRIPLSVDRAHVRLASMIEPMQRVVARLRGELQIPGASEAQVLPFVDKVEMKRAMRGVDDWLPRYVVADVDGWRADPRAAAAGVVAELGLPVFAKPRAENSCAGTARLDTVEQLAGYIERATTAFEVDEFVEGDVYHLDSVVVDGVTRWFGAGRYVWPPYKTLTGAPLADIVIGPTHPQFEELRTVNGRLLCAFPAIPDGCTHLEAIRRADGRWYFLEIACRTPGWRIPEIHRIHRGVDLRVVHYQVQAGLDPDLEERPGPVAGYYCPLKTDPGRIERVHEPPFRSACEMTWSRSWQQSTGVVRANTMADFLGAAVLRNESWDALWQDLASLDGFRPYTIAGS